MKISAAMIIKRGETAQLSKCLESIRPYVSEIVGVVDPRGSDDTDSVLRSYGARKVDHIWTGDYAEARNISIENVIGDYIFVIDTDEYVTEFKFIPDDDISVYRILRENEYCDADYALQNKERLNRFFRRGLFHYEGRVHEQLVADSHSEYITADTDITIYHTGYTDGKSMLEKCLSRRSDLLIMLASAPDDPYILFQIGRTYYVEKDFGHAADYFEKAILLDPDPSLEYVEQLIETYGYALINSREYAKAMSLFAVYDRFSRYADFLFLCGLIYMDNARFDEAVAEFAKATRIQQCSVEGVNSYLAWYNCGVIRECLGFKKDAADFYKKCGNYAPALDGIIRCSS